MEIPGKGSNETGARVSAHMNGDDESPLPTFLIIGAQKSATRWLRANLGQHPEVFTADHEVKYFNHPRRIDTLGIDWYREQFAGWGGESVIGEATPGYLVLRHHPDEVAARIDQALPGVRLLAILRNPVDRAHSAFVHHRRSERIHPRATLLEQLGRQAPEDDWMALVTGGWYAASLAPFVERFGDRLDVLIHDDVRRDPSTAYAQACRHVGAAPDFEPPDLAAVVETNRTDANPLSTEDRRAIFDRYFRDDVERLEGLIHCDLSPWRP